MNVTAQPLTTGRIEHSTARASHTGVRIDVLAGSPVITLGGLLFRADTVYTNAAGKAVSATLTRITKSGADHLRARRGGFIRLDDLDSRDDAAALRAIAAPAITGADPRDLTREVRDAFEL